MSIESARARVWDRFDHYGVWSKEHCDAALDTLIDEVLEAMLSAPDFDAEIDRRRKARLAAKVPA